MKALTPMMDELRINKERFDFYNKTSCHYEMRENCLIEGNRRFPAGSYAWIRKDMISTNKTILPILLRNYDRNSMASGVEIRMPLFRSHHMR
jgi:hypothetical protein